MQSENSVPFYGSLVRFILDYRSPQSHLSILDSVHNATIRICTGAFRTSPTLSLCAESGYSPLHYRRLNLSASLLTSVLQLPDTNVD